MEKNKCNEINDLSSPQVIEHYVGQEKVKQMVKVALEACWADGSRFPDTLALGGPGLGKTAIGQLIALEMGAICKEILATSFRNISDLHAFLINARDHDILFLDELHCLSKDLMTVLYRATESKKAFIQSNTKKNPITVNLAKFTLIGATTDFYLLPKPMLDRFKLILNFEFYTDEEIELILRNRCKKLNWQSDDAVFPDISKRSRGIPRIALRILENTRRVARSENNEIINQQHLLKYFLLEGMDAIGLIKNERQYLSILAQSDVPVRLGTIAMMMGLNPRNISQTIEPYLFRSGLIIKNEKGRSLTPKGLEHIRANPIQ